jgi:hypothetical protein
MSVLDRCASDHGHRLVLGTLVLATLYFKLTWLGYGIVAVLFFEGLTGWRLPAALLGKRGGGVSCVGSGTPRFDFEAERALRLMFAMVLLLGMILFYDLLWFFPWFLGFAVLGAGVSRVCPMLIFFKWCGFK